MRSALQVSLAGHIGMNLFGLAIHSNVSAKVGRLPRQRATLYCRIRHMLRTVSRRMAVA
nr:MAG TPA: hypothetical protein [Caudoviricetes sp.]